MATGDEWEENREHVGRNETRLSPDFHLSSRYRNYDFWRIWEQRHPNLLPATTESGGRRGRISSQTRLNLGADAVAHAPAFANKDRDSRQSLEL